MSLRRIIVVGGGPAGFLAAITCAEAEPGAAVVLLEKSGTFLGKVRISGGGRCNVTHACFDPRELAAGFPRGEQELLGPFQRFQARDTVAWFGGRGVKLKTEPDGRLFPITDSSQTIIDCLVGAAMAAGVKLIANCGVDRVAPVAGRAGFNLTTSHGETLTCDRLLLATGGCRTTAGGNLPVALGHSLVPPVPSLFSFHLETPWVRGLAGVSVARVAVAVPGTGLRDGGALLLTHEGLSGPVILRLSAWGARLLHDRAYRFPLEINWLPPHNAETLASELPALRAAHAARLVANTPLPPLPARLWAQLVFAAGVERATRWARLSRAGQHRLAHQLVRTELPVTGQSLNKEEFVTCGGVRLAEVNFQTMASRLCPGLYFAGELLDLDGITGGYNFQAAWTTGWIAGQAMAGRGAGEP